ncbi:hypothetical protein B0H65DRAFT_572953 [Neurospora tetraspora]|uniref:Xylanolytic transcriptional activator regulatory domain-containing protein n=1 Tax=Neurospora tetraspora TaxID=94610 RepID=A0AAE0MR71_9PEZI|nr:hypothetical protein B0H65DRAFT_572953 [Neurospora tetraspora]
MTALSLEGGFDFNIQVNHNEYLPDPNHHTQTRAVSDKPPPRKRRRICDRKLPCTNCIARHKEDDCQYDSGAPTAKEQQRHQQPKRARRTSSNVTGIVTPGTGPDETMGSMTKGHWPQESSPDDNDHQILPSNVSNVTNLGYSTTGASTSTLGFLHKIESHSKSSSLPQSPSTLPPSNGNGRASTAPTDIVNRYKSLIRQLPARVYVEKLVDTYFRDFNWQYSMLDRDIFDKQLEEWYKVPFGVLSNGGPGAIPPDLRVFSAVLFQVVSIGMLVLPEKTAKGNREEVITDGRDGEGGGREEEKSGSKGPRTGRDKEDVDFEALKYAGNMTFEDLATEYSESGVAIVSLLGKRQMTLTTVLAGFVRASFLKFVGMVPEAWHAIGTAIRDAQELGLHRPSLDPRPPPSATADAILQNQWEIQRRRTVWLNLVTWDIHCGATLGRPSTIDLTTNPPILPIDVALPITTLANSRSPTPIIPRSEDDPPTPLTRILWACKITLQLVSILALEKEGPCPASFSKVDLLHQHLLDLEDSIPSYFRLHNPDTRFDSLPECYWIPWARALLPQLTAFNFMALHRPYIFTRPESRRLAVEKGCLGMLRAQRTHFEMLRKEMRQKTFALFFGTFDAIVLMGAVYILFPREQGTKRLVGEVMQQFKWAEERFEEMRERNPLARQARGVVRGVGERLGRAVGVELGGGGKEGCLASGGAEGVGKTPAVAVGGRERRLPRQKRLIKPVTDTQNGLSPALSTSVPPGTASRGTGNSSTTPATATSSTTEFPTPESSAPSSLAQGQFGAATSDINNNNNITNNNITNNNITNTAFDASSTFPFDNNTSCIPIDPSLNPVPAPVLSLGAADWAAAPTLSASMSLPSLPSLPEDFSWTNISPIYATGDLVYNDLTGFVYDGFESAVHDDGNHLVQNGGGGGCGDGNEVGLGSGAGLVIDTDANMGAEDAESGGMVEMMGLNHDNNVGDRQSQSEALWMFDGRGIGEGTCVWGLLNRY